MTHSPLLNRPRHGRALPAVLLSLVFATAVVSAVDSSAPGAAAQFLPLGGVAREVVSGAGGEWLFFSLPAEKQIVAFDVRKRERIRVLEVEKPLLIAAGADFLVSADSAARRLHRWRLPSFEALPDIRLECKTVAMAMGPRRASVVNLYLEPGLNLDEPAWYDLDLASGRLTPAAWADHRQTPLWDFANESLDQSIRPNAAGNAWSVQQGRSALNFVLLMQGAFSRPVASIRNWGPALPSADGAWLGWNGGAILPGDPLVTPRFGPAPLSVPADDGNSYLRLAQKIREDKSAEEGVIVEARNWHQPDLRVALDPIENEFLLAGKDGRYGPVSLNQKFWYYPELETLAYVGFNSTRLGFHPIPAARLRAGGLVYLDVAAGPPPAVVGGRPFSHRVAAVGGQPPYSFQLGGAPEGVTLSTDGTLAWNPPAKALREPSRAEVRVRDSANREILHVVPLAGPLLPASLDAFPILDARVFQPSLGRTDLNVKTFLYPHPWTRRVWVGWDNQAYWLSDGTLEKGPTRVLEKRYIKLRPREKSWVAMHKECLDILDLETFQPLRSFAAPDGWEFQDFEIHPGGSVSYASLRRADSGSDAGADDSLGRIVQIDEETGRMLFMEGFRGKRVAVSGDGTRVYSVLPADSGWLAGQPDDPDGIERHPERVVAYDVSRPVPVAMGFSTNFLSRVGLRPLPGDRGLMAHTGSIRPGESRLTRKPFPILETPDVSKIKGFLSLPFDTYHMAFHPVLPLHVGGGQEVFYIGVSNPLEPKPDRFYFQCPDRKEPLIFLVSGWTTDGKVALTQMYSYRTGHFLLLALDPGLQPGEFPANPAAPVVAAAPPVRHLSGMAVDWSALEKPDTPVRRLFDDAPPAREVESTSLPSRTTPQRGAALASLIRPSALVVQSGTVTGSGVVVGRDGWIVTAASLADPGAEVPIVWVTDAKGQRIRLSASLVLHDEAVGLALLKAQVGAHPVAAAPLAPVDGPAEGARLSLLGAVEGEAGEAPELAMSQGVLAARERQLSGRRYWQLTAPVTPAQIGAGLFDASGNLCGILAAVAGLEDTAFAIPLATVREFLRGASVVPRP